MTWKTDDDGADGLRATDARLLVPFPPARAAVLSGLEHWQAGLLRAGVTPVGPDEGPDLVVARGADADRAVASGANALILEGGGSSVARAAGFAVRRLLPLPTVRHPDLIVPLDRPRVARDALRARTCGARGLDRLRGPVVAALASIGAPPPGRAPLVVASRSPGPPFVIVEAARLGVPADGDWYVWLGRGDALQRVVFTVFPRGASVPGWVVKVGRVPGYTESFERDEAGMAVLPADPAVAGHAPVFLGRSKAADLGLSVETAATGSKFSDMLPGMSRNAALVLISRVVDWLIAFAGATRALPAKLAPELRRLRQDVLPPWSGTVGLPIADDLLGCLGGVAPVAQHNDVGCWNIIAAPPQFTVVDWESARAHGLPLWDLLYFLVDAFAHLDGARSPADRAEHAITLLRGDSEWSPRAFAALQQCVAAVEVPPGAIGAIATLCWLHHGVSSRTRARALVHVAAPHAQQPQAMELIARRWVADTKLGVGWDWSNR